MRINTLGKSKQRDLEMNGEAEPLRLVDDGAG